MGMKWANGGNDNRKRLPVKRRGKSSPIELLNIGARSNESSVSYGGFDDSKSSRDSLPPLALKQSSRN
jgi:hypothetical protein